MEILKIISRLMDYPTAELKEHTDELITCINDTRVISPQQRQGLVDLVDDIYGRELMDAQENYTGLYDRGRSLSLLLFEHVHGESRDRGQAMVDLMAQYEENGFHISVRELPDYIPLYLEYLSERPDLEAREGLADVAHIFGLLSARLQERDSHYSALFSSLLQISGQQVDVEALRERAANEERDDTPEALDRVWEEEAIKFGGDDQQEACPTQQFNPANSAGKIEKPVQTDPIHFVDIGKVKQSSAQQSSEQHSVRN